MRFLKCVIAALLLGGLQVGLAMLCEKIIPSVHNYWFDQFRAGSLTAWWCLYIIQPLRNEYLSDNKSVDSQLKT